MDRWTDLDWTCVLGMTRICGGWRLFEPRSLRIDRNGLGLFATSSRGEPESHLSITGFDSWCDGEKWVDMDNYFSRITMADRRFLYRASTWSQKRTRKDWKLEKDKNKNGKRYSPMDRDDITKHMSWESLKNHFYDPFNPVIQPSSHHSYTKSTSLEQTKNKRENSEPSPLASHELETGRLTVERGTPDMIRPSFE